MKRLFTFICLVSLVTVFFALSAFAQEGAVASVGGVEYNSLQDAIDAAGKGDTVLLLTDLEIETDVSTGEAKGYFSVYADDEITIDFNGKTISATESATGHFILFYNRGTLTVQNGAVDLTSTVNRGWNALSAVFMNRGGVFTVESGAYEHKGGTDMAFALDNSGNSFGDAYAYINGGSLVSTYRAIRLRMADTTLNGGGNGIVSLTVTGGEIYGANSGVWGQITNAYAGELGDLGITGGTIGGGKTAINMAKDEHENIDVTISGDAHINGVISGEASDFAISGGTFTSAIPEGFLAQGFSPVLNSDGSYSVAIDLSAAFTFLGYSINNEHTSITAGYNVNQETLALWREQNGVESFDFGCVFGINGVVSEKSATSFARYTEYQNFNAKIKGIDSSNSTHINSNLSMALYVNRGNGMEYVVELDGEIAIVGAEDIPSVTFASFVK